jgi:hypothetical protein
MGGDGMDKVTELRMKRVLQNLKLWKEYNDGLLRCEFCHSLITGGNLASLFYLGDHSGAGCDRYECYKEYLKLHMK